MICALWASSDGKFGKGEAVACLELAWHGMGRLVADAAHRHALVAERLYGATWRDALAEAESLLRTGWCG